MSNSTAILALIAGAALVAMQVFQSDDVLFWRSAAVFGVAGFLGAAIEGFRWMRGRPGEK